MTLRAVQLRDMRHVCDGRPLAEMAQPPTIPASVWLTLQQVYRDAERCSLEQVPDCVRSLKRMWKAVMLSHHAEKVQYERAIVMATNLLRRRTATATMLQIEQTRPGWMNTAVHADMVERVREDDFTHRALEQLLRDYDAALTMLDLSRAAIV